MGILQPTTVDGRKPANRLRLVVFQVVQDLFHQQYVSLLEGKCFRSILGYRNDRTAFTIGTTISTPALGVFKQFLCEINMFRRLKFNQLPVLLFGVCFFSRLPMSQTSRSSLFLVMFTTRMSQVPEVDGSMVIGSMG